jgi:hypothetical protein
MLKATTQVSRGFRRFSMKCKRQRRKFNFEGVKLRHVVVPDADIRLSRAIDILLRSAARKAAASEESINAKKEEEPPRESPAEDTLTGGDEESNSHE